MCADATVTKFMGDVQAYKVRCGGLWFFCGADFLAEFDCKQYQDATVSEILLCWTVLSPATVCAGYVAAVLLDTETLSSKHKRPFG